MVCLEGVAKSFDGVRVLDGLSLEVSEGETLAVVGRSGAGKSVLLKHAAGLLDPDEGAVWIGERRISGARPEVKRRLRRQMGYVFQFAALFDSMTVAENILMALRRRELTIAERKERVARSLEVVGLRGEEDRYPAELSGGMRKRVGLARAVAGQPEYLLYDEPTSGLDPVTRAIIDELILRLKDHLGCTSILVTHDMTSAYRVADRIAMLHEGKVRWIGPTSAIESVEDPVIRSFVEGRSDLWPEVEEKGPHEP